VQGDIPEVPAEAKLKYAGPLTLAPVPKELVPRFVSEEMVRLIRSRDTAEVLKEGIMTG